MRYTNKKYGFSFEIPQGWKEKSQSWLFRLAEGEVSIIPEGYDVHDANINVSCGQIQPDLNDPQHRAFALQQFLSSKGYNVIQLGVGDTELAGEKNIVDAVYKSPDGLASKISIVHNGIEYVLTFGGNIAHDKYKKDLEMVTDSFRF